MANCWSVCLCWKSAFSDSVLCDHLTLKSNKFNFVSQCTKLWTLWHSCKRFARCHDKLLVYDHTCMHKNYYCYRSHYYRKYTVIQTCAMRTADTKLMFPFGRTWFSLDSSLPTSVVSVTSTSVLSHNNTESVMTIMPDDIAPELARVLFWAGTMSLRSGLPRVRPGHPLSPLSLHFPVFCFFFLFSVALTISFFCPSLSFLPE